MIWILLILTIFVGAVFLARKFPVYGENGKPLAERIVEIAGLIKSKVANLWKRFK